MERERLVWGFVCTSTSNRERIENGTNKIPGNDAERGLTNGKLLDLGYSPKQDEDELGLNMVEHEAGLELCWYIRKRAL